MKRYIIIGGVNGAGKSTFFSTEQSFAYLEKINLDDIVRQNGDWKNHQDVISAGKEVLKRINYCFSNGISFCQESTLCGKSILNNLKKAKKLGFRTELYYVGPDNVEIAKQRVKERVCKGGHGIPDADIERRYIESLENLSLFTKECDLAVVYDNTNSFRRFAIYKSGRLVRLSINIPQWYQNVLT